MDKNKQILYKAALLHDIGKFWQRTRHKETYKEKGEGSGQKKHPLLSEGFVDEWLKDDLIADIVAFHHKEDLNKSELKGEARALASLVCAADHLSSGEREEDDKPFHRYFQSIFSKITLPPHARRSEKCAELKPQYKQDICSLTKSGYKFPFEDKNPDGTMKDGYQAQWGNLKNDAPHLADAHDDTLFYLSKKHLWAVPSAYYFSQPDISLHEHSRLAAAIAVCLYDFIGDQKDSLPLEEWTLKYVQSFNEQNSFRLLCAELSGIQKYIYHIAHTGAMRALKGRSFWLQQIVDSVASYILEQFKLPLANLVFSGGGKLIILLPNTNEVIERLPGIQSMVEKLVFDEYDGNISLVFGDIELRGKDFFEKTESGKGKIISEKWDKLYKKVEESKARKLMSRFDAKFFEAQDLYGAILQCKATKREICLKMPEEAYSPVEREIGIVPFNEFHFPVPNQKPVKAFQLFNKAVPPTPTEDFICEEQFNSQRVGYKIRKDCLGIARTKKGFGVLDDLDHVTFYKKGKELKSPKNLLLFNNDNFLQELPGTSIPKGWKFYGGDWVPLKDDRDSTREFEEIIADAIGIERLGVLRMDVDNLGEIFRDGLNEYATFSRIVQLSAMLDFFFSGYLNVLKEMYWTAKRGIVAELNEQEKPIHERNEAIRAGNAKKDKKESPDSIDPEVVKLRDILQIVYAGGDDLFIVSVWNVLPDLAWWIRQQFKAFTCQNPCFEVSAGIALFDNKYPVYKAAKYAGQALDDAKSKWKDKNDKEHEKGRISFLGKAMSWTDFEISRHLAKELYKTKGELKRGLLGRLGEMYDDYYSVKQQLKWLKKHGRKLPFEKAEYSKWRWRGCYTLYRFAEQNRHKADDIKQLASGIFTSNYQFEDKSKPVTTDTDFITFLDVPVRWADLLIRTKK